MMKSKSSSNTVKSTNSKSTSATKPQTKGVNAKVSSTTKTTKGKNINKIEAAEELSVNSSRKSTTSRQNGKIGGQVTKELFNRGQSKSNPRSMKYEIADELGVEIGPNATARQNGKVGGQITKTCVNRGKRASSKR